MQTLSIEGEGYLRQLDGEVRQALAELEQYTTRSSAAESEELSLAAN